MGTGASTSLYRHGSDASLQRGDSAYMSRSARIRSGFGSMWHSIKHAGSSLRHGAGSRLHHFDSSFYDRGDEGPAYVHYSVYGDGEGSDPDDPLVYELKRTKAMDEHQWFDMATANEQLSKLFNSTKNAFGNYYSKYWKKKKMTPEEIREKEAAKNKWREFFVKTQEAHEQQIRAEQEARQKRAEELARLPPPEPHPCERMSANQKIHYYENIFGYSLKRAEWVDSPDWKSLEVPAKRRRRLQAPQSSSSSSSSSSNSNSTATTTSNNSSSGSR